VGSALAVAVGLAVAAAVAVAVAVAVGLAVALAVAVGLAFMPPPPYCAKAVEASSRISTALTANTSKTFFIKQPPFLEADALSIGDHLPFLLRHCGPFIQQQSTGASPHP
jgi:hypothetical protein